MSQEHAEWLASLPPDQREALNKGLSALETMADIWAAEVNLGKMSDSIAAAPDVGKRAFAIRSMVEQGFIEGAYRTFLDYKDGKLPGQATPPEALPTDPGTEKLLRGMLDRAYKMMQMAGYRVVDQNPDHNNPIIAWMADARHVLYGSGHRPEVEDLQATPSPLVEKNHG